MEFMKRTIVLFQTHSILILFLSFQSKRMIDQKKPYTKRKARMISSPEKWQPEDFRHTAAPKKRLKKHSNHSFQTKNGMDDRDDLEESGFFKDPVNHKYHPYLCHKPFLLLTQKGQCKLCSTTLCPFDTQVDHIIPKKHSEIFDLSLLNSRENLQAICGKCHNIKTRNLDRQIDQFIQAKTPLSRKFEDAVEHTRLFMTKKHTAIRKHIASYALKKEDREKTLVDNGYNSDFSSKSYDSEAEFDDLENALPAIRPLPPVVVLDQTDVDTDNEE